MASTSPQQPHWRFNTPLPGTAFTPAPVPLPAPAPITPLPTPTPVSVPGPVPGQTAAPEIWRQQTIPQPAVSPSDSLFDLDQPSLSESIVPARIKRKRWGRTMAVALLLVLVVALYLTWYTPTPATSPAGITQQNFGSTSTSNTTANSASSTGSSGGTIQVYIVGAVKHPGVYQLPADARLYQLLQAAGGPLPDANLVALNLAAKVSDGEEVYVIRTGETPPTYYGGVPGIGTGTNTGNSNGQLVNINTASLDEMRQQLHISSATAQAILNYRQQNGAFTSVDQLLQVVSKSIYDKIKGEVTV